MKLHRIAKSIGAAALAAMLLTGSACAEYAAIMPISAKVSALELAQPIRVYGAVSDIGETRFMLSNSNKNDPYQKISVNVSDETIILDAVTGESKAFKDIKENQTVYAYVGPAIGASMPPVGGAVLVLCNIPADFGVPKFATVETVTAKEDGAVDVLMTGNTLLHLTKDTQISPYLTKNIVTPASITAGMRLLSWYSAETRSIPSQATPTRVMVFPAVSDPLAAITRGEFIDAMYASVKDPKEAPNAPFSDVSQSAAINWAFANKIALGDENSAFVPNESMTRQELMVFLVRYAAFLGKGPQGSWAVRITYADSNAISDWAMEGAMWNEITTLVAPDKDNNILPTASVTIAEAEAAISALLARK